MTLTVELDRNEAAALLEFLQRVSFEAVAQVLSPNDAKAFEDAAAKLRVMLRREVEP